MSHQICWQEQVACQQGHMSTGLYSQNLPVLQDKISTPKTKTLVEALERWGLDQEEYGLLILSEKSPNVELSARNVDKLKLNTVDYLNVYDILRADKIIMEESAFKYIQEFYGPNSGEPASPSTVNSEESAAEAPSAQAIEEAAPESS